MQQLISDKKLCQYLESNCKEECFCEIIKAGLESFYIYSFIDNKPLYYNIRYKYEMQKIFNSLVIKEMTDLTNIFLRENIKIIFLKGYTLSYQLYSPHYYRLFSDIDCLIDYSNIEKTVTILKNIGYTFKGSNNYSINDIITNDIHLKPLVKKVVDINSGKMFELYLEVHHSLISKIDLNGYEIVELSQSFISRSEILKINNSNYYINKLEKTDELFHNIVHFCKDFEHLLKDCIKNSERKYLKHRQLLDIAYLIEKNYENIDFNRILLLADSIKSLDKLLFVTKIINEIFNDIFSLKEFEVAIINIINMDYYRESLYFKFINFDLRYVITNPINLAIFELLKNKIYIDNKIINVNSFYNKIYNINKIKQEKSMDKDTSNKVISDYLGNISFQIKHQNKQLFIRIQQDKLKYNMNKLYIHFFNSCEYKNLIMIYIDYNNNKAILNKNEIITTLLRFSKTQNNNFIWYETTIPFNLISGDICHLKNFLMEIRCEFNISDKQLVSLKLCTNSKHDWNIFDYNIFQMI